MEVNHFVTLYLTTPTATVIEAVQGDGVRVIAARLMEGAEAWPVPDGVSAGIGYELPDKTGGYYDRLADGTPACMIAGDLVTAAIDGSLTAIPGNVKLSIVLRDSDGGQVATFPVTMRVAKRPGRIGAEEMAPVSAFDGKLIMGGAGGETIPVSVGTGLHIQRLGNGAVLTAPGGSSEAPGGSCDCGDAYVASDEPPEDTSALWIDTSDEPDEAVALGATIVETEEGVEIYATDELGTTKATVRHGRDGAPGATGKKGDPGDPGAPGADGITPHIGDNGNWWIGATDTGKPSRGADGKTPVKGTDYFTPAEAKEIAEQAAGMVEVPGGGGEMFKGTLVELVNHTVTAEEAVAAKFVFTKDEYPNIGDHKTLLVDICNGQTVFVASWSVLAGTVDIGRVDNNTFYGASFAATVHNNIWLSNHLKYTSGAVQRIAAPGYTFDSLDTKRNYAYEPYDKITISSYQAFLPEGAVIKIWGGA